MSKGIKKTGVPSWEELKDTSGLPDEKRLEEGPVAFIECVQEIPCNPCELACPSGAITVGRPITNLPRIEGEKCTGCSLCLAACPGLAIFKVHKNYSETTSLVEFPFEFLPLPQECEIVRCVDRYGRFVTEGRVIKVKRLKKYDLTPLITIEVPKIFFSDVRSIEREVCNND
ncbi:MAG: 4Fe-4S binding protein [Dethiobacter sp.]|jgi:Fe-S-cluster-containing hydrogenase component 2|nr:4Fe-4S binding protein [Dethiobacter sp.]